MSKRLPLLLVIVFLAGRQLHGQSTNWGACSGGATTCTTANVGVGTLNPSFPFTIDNTVAGYLARIYNHSASGSGLDIVSFATGTQAVLLARGNDGNTLSLSVLANGNVGIGTSSPQASLHLYTSAGSNTDLLRIEGAGNAPSYGMTINGLAGPTAAIRASYTNPANTTATELKFYTNPVGGNNNLQQRVVIDGAGNVGIGTPTPAYTLDVNGSIRATMVIGAVYQDVAEWVPANETMPPGTVVVLNPDRSNEVIPSTHSYDTSVAGVVSEKPGLLLGEASDSKAKIATTGRVRVRVDATQAPIRIGDLLVTSDRKGVAMKSEAVEVNGRRFHQPGTILGKALEPLNNGAGEILVLLSLQ